MLISQPPAVKGSGATRYTPQAADAGTSDLNSTRIPSQFQKAGDFNGPNTASVQQQAEVNRQHTNFEPHFLAEERGCEVWPICVGLNHHEFQGSTHLLEVAVKLTKVASKNLAPLPSEPAFHLARKPRLRAEEVQILGVQQSQHRLVPLRRKFLKPIQRYRQGFRMHSPVPSPNDRRHYREVESFRPLR
jgi:hypothetical protein